MILELVLAQESAFATAKVIAWQEGNLAKETQRWSWQVCIATASHRGVTANTFSLGTIEEYTRPLPE